MSTLLASPVLDNPAAAGMSIVSSEFREDFSAELELQAQHYLWWQARQLEEMPLTPETAIEKLNAAFPKNDGVAVLVEYAMYPGKPMRVQYSVHVHLASWHIPRCHIIDLDAAVSEIIAEGSAYRAA